MRGRLLSIKKSTWLLISLILNFMAFFTMSAVSIAVWKEYDAVFFLFCGFTGIHQIFKSILFKLDSSCYLGLVLLLIGLFYFLCKPLNLVWIYPVFILLSLSFASLTVAYFFKEPFQYFLSFSLFFVGIGVLLFLLKIISVCFFVAISLISVLILVIRFFTL